MKGERGAAARSAPRLAIAAALALAFATAPLSGASATGGQDGGSHNACDDKNGHRSADGKGHHSRGSGKGHAKGKDKGKDHAKGKGHHHNGKGKDKGKGKHGDDSGHGKDKGCVGKGKIVIKKKAFPAGSAQAFAFTAASLDADGFALKDGESVTFDNLTPGTFAVSENATSGWQLVKIHCHDATGDTTVSGSTATIKVAAGETVHCVFKNKQTPRGKIVVQKVSSPGDATAFAFVAPTLDADGFTLTGGQSATFDNLTPGTYVVSETALAGWTLQTLVCVDATSNTTIAGATATIDVAAGETVTCTFTNAPVAAPTVVPPTPVVPTPVTPAPTAQTPPAGGVLPETAQSVTPRASLNAPSQCVRGTYRVRVSGRPVSRVAFFVNGRLVRTVRARSGQTRFAVTIPVRAGRVQRLRARVTFASNARPRSRTLNATMFRCSAARGVLPQFTG